MTFGERISMHRKQLKLSQDELAKKVGTSGPIIGRYERNEIKPSIDTAKNIADALQVTIDYLISGSGSVVLDKKMSERIATIEQMPEDEKNKVLSVVDALIRDFKAKQAYL